MVGKRLEVGLLLSVSGGLKKVVMQRQEKEDRSLRGTGVGSDGQSEELYTV